jgi:hypothetical protein
MIFHQGSECLWVIMCPVCHQLESHSDFCCGAHFVDHATGRIAVHHQVSLGANDTIKSKLLFERNKLEDGVRVQAYYTVNGIFSSREFLTERVSKGQTSDSLGVERGIRTVVGINQDHDAALRYGDKVITQDLWP